MVCNLVKNAGELHKSLGVLHNRKLLQILFDLKYSIRWELILLELECQTGLLKREKFLIENKYLLFDFNLLFCIKLYTLNRP